VVGCCDPNKVATTLPPGLLPQQSTTLGIHMEFVNTHGQQAEYLGRSDYIGAYHSEAYGLESTIKQAEREKVLDFILGFYGKPVDCIKLLSLPGIDWTFERMMRATRPMAHFVGLEHSYSAYMRSRRAIPGINAAYGIYKDKGVLCEEQAQLQDRQFRFGDGDYVYSRRSNREESHKRTIRANRLLYMKADTYMTMLASDYGATMEQKKAFNAKFMRRNAVWLDFTSQFCKSVQSCMEWLPLCLDGGEDEKPVVITTMNARDGVTGVQNRIDRLIACQPAFIYKDHWTYLGKNGTPMLTVCGVVV